MNAHHHGTVPGLAAPELAHHPVVDRAPLGTSAARAVVRPTSDNAPGRARVEEQRATNCIIFEQHADDGKRFATLRRQGCAA